MGREGQSLLVREEHYKTKVTYDIDIQEETV